MYGQPILKNGKDYHELTRAEFIKMKMPVPNYPPDTEDGKYVLFSISGMMKMCMARHLCNALWLHFADCFDLKIDAPKFTRSNDYIDALIKAKTNPKFKGYERVIEIALDQTNCLFENRYNFIYFMKLCEEFGKEYGTLDSEKEFDKDIEFYAEAFYTLLNKTSKKIQIL